MYQTHHGFRSKKYMNNWTKILTATALGKTGMVVVLLGSTFPALAEHNIALFAAIARAVAAFVLFGNPFTLINGEAVGVLAGAAAAGFATLGLHLVEPVLSCCRLNFAVAIAFLRRLGFPVLQRYLNLHADPTNAALALAAVLGLVATSCWFVRTAVQSRHGTQLGALVCNHFPSRGSSDCARREPD